VGDVAGDPGVEAAPPAFLREKAWSLGPTVGLLLMGMLFVLPLVWLVLAAFDAHATSSLRWPDWSIANFTAAGSSANLESLLRSLELGLISAAVATVPAVPAGYALSRRHIPLKDGLMVAVLFLTAVPIAIVVIPVYVFLSSNGLLNLLPAGIFIGVTNLPFALWLVRAAVQSVPEDLEEAAVMERAHLWQVIVRVTGPLAAPGIAASAFFAFAAGWSAFLVPLVVISAPSQTPAAIALFGFIHAGSLVQYGDLAAFSLMYSLPVVVIYLLVSRLVKGGFAFGGAVRG
jgi:multiple sugar transport system permease protein